MQDIESASRKLENDVEAKKKERCRLPFENENIYLHDIPLIRIPHDMHQIYKNESVDQWIVYIISTTKLTVPLI